MMKGEKRLFESEPACKLAESVTYRVASPDRPAHDSQAAGEAVSFGIDVADEFQAGQERQRVVPPLSPGGRRVHFPSIIKTPQRAGNRTGVEERIQRGQEQRAHG
jgi:hypothetical protein